MLQRSGGQARVKKGMFELIGIPMGASRPPRCVECEEMAELRDIMRSFGWKVVK